MNAERLLQYFDRIIEAPDAILRLRQFILDLAVRGKLVEQEPDEEQVAHDYLNEPPSDELPENWRLLKFGKFCDIQGGNQPPKSQFIDEPRPGYVRLFQIRDLGETPVPTYIPEGTTNRFCKEGEILIGRYGASVGKVFWAQDGAYNVALAKFIYPDNAFAPQFAFLVLRSNFFQSKLTGATRSAQAGFNKGDLAEIDMPLPPLAEQHRIVAKVDELMALCDQLEAAKTEREQSRDRLVAASLHHLNQPTDVEEADTPEAFRNHARFIFNHLSRLTTRPEHIKQLRQTILNLAVRGQLVPQDPNDEPAAELLKRIREEKARLVKEGIIPRQKVRYSDQKGFAIEYPMKWETVNFGSICNLVTSGSRGWAEFYSDAGSKFIRAQNIRFGSLHLDDLACVNPPKKTEGTRTRVSSGDLLIVITGAGVTNPALLDRELGEAYVSQHVALIKPTETSLSRWLLLCLMAPAGGRGELVERAYGAGRPGLNLDNIRSLNIPLPPLAEQHRIVAKVDELMALCDQLEAQLTITEADSRRLLEAVLHEALAPALEETA